MKKIFEGELSKIDPGLLINKDEEDSLGSFFIALGLIFNDLKGIIAIERIIEESYEKPAEDEVTFHSGSYGGIFLQTQKLLVSVISEFFVFLKENNKILNSQDFKTIFDRLGKSDQELWRQLIDAANGRFSNVSEFLQSMFKIRSNIAFHYDHSGKVLLRGYRSIFFGDVEGCRNEFAYYSIGQTIEQTRFYFSDAAAEESMHIMAGKQLKENSKDNEALIKYKRQVIDTIIVMSASIAALVNNFIKYRRNRPR